MSRSIRTPHPWLTALAVGAVSLATASWQHAAAQAPAPAPAAHAPHWSYEGAEDPSHWAALSPDFALCGAGHQQSPIDIVSSVAARCAPVPASRRPGSIGPTFGRCPSTSSTTATPSRWTPSALACW